MVVTFSHHPRRLERIAATSRQRSRGVQSKRLAEPTGTESSSAPQLTFLRAGGWELLKANNRDL
jgi:hypothetical protein